MPAERPLTIAWMGHHSKERGDGVITYSRVMTEGLRQRGHRVLFFHYDESQDQAGPGSRPDGHEHFPLRSITQNRLYVLSSPGSRARIAEVLKQEKVDVMHVSLAFSSVDFGLPDLCHELGIPIVGTLHIPYDTRLTVWSSISSVFYRLYSGSLATYDSVVIFSEAQREIMAGFGIPEEVISVVPNGVDVDRYCPGPSEYRARLGAGTLLTYLGRLDPEKNVDYLLRAFVEMDAPEDAHVVVVGAGSEKARLQRRFRHPRIHFTGMVTEEAARIDILRGSDAFFLPSSVEGLSLAMLEAMACGVCTIATDVGGDGHALNGAGMVLDLKDAEAQLRLALRMVIQFPELRAQLGRAARERVTERYSIARNLDHLVRIYRGLQPTESRRR